jgi:hypothetical protein
MDINNSLTNELEISMEAVMANLKYYPEICLEILRKAGKTPQSVL